MRKIETTYEEFHTLFSSRTDQKFYVETNNGNFTEILDTCKKNTSMISVKFSNGYTLECAEEHVFMDNEGDAVFAKDLKIHSQILTKFGTISVVSKKKSKNTEAFDISIEAPHWYVNDEVGIIHHNTGFTLLLMKAYMDKYPESVCLFYDSEFGTPQAYFDTFGIDTSRVIHTPLTDIEQLKFDVMTQLEGIKRGDRVFIALDSAGNIASKKEVEDAIAGKSVADMSRAKQLKSLFRMITPHLKIKQLPMVVVNHIYQCGTEDMTVLTPDRGVVSLKDISVGDMVMTVSGPEEVLFTTINEDAWVTDVEMEDGTVLSFTNQHRFMVDGKWKYVEDLLPGDVLDVK